VRPRADRGGALRILLVVAALALAGGCVAVIPIPVKTGERVVTPAADEDGG
jgi:hypothetical protein